MFKLFSVVFAAILALAVAAPGPKPGLVASPLAYSAPLAYSGYSSPYVASYAAPSVVSGYGAPLAYSGYGSHAVYY